MRYPQAKVHTCFDNDLNGNLYDIKVSGIISNTEMTIKENKDDVLFKTKGREFTINKNDVSLESFREKDVYKRQPKEFTQLGLYNRYQEEVPKT